MAALLASKRALLTRQLDEMSVRPEDAGSISFGKRVGEGTSEAVDRLAAVPAHDKLQVMLAEVVRAERHQRRTEGRAEERERVRRAIERGDDRRAALGSGQQRR